MLALDTNVLIAFQKREERRDPDSADPDKAGDVGPVEAQTFR